MEIGIRLPRVVGLGADETASGKMTIGIAIKRTEVINTQRNRKKDEPRLSDTIRIPTMQIAQAQRMDSRAQDASLRAPPFRFA
jgi:hypothetical protein